MTGRRAFAILMTVAVTSGVGRAQTPQATQDLPATSPADAALRPPLDGAPQTDPIVQVFRSSGAFATATVLAVRPGAALLTFEDSAQLHGGFLSWTAAAQAEFGYRCANDVSWLAAVQVMPVANAATVLGMDLDRLSTNRSANPLVDRRWEIGVRMMAVAAPDAFIVLGIGPHAGLNWHRTLGDPQVSIGRFTLDARLDVGILFTRVVAPYVDLRSELGLTFHPSEFPHLSISAGAYNEAAWFIIAGAMTPGVYLRLGREF